MVENIGTKEYEKLSCRSMVDSLLGYIKNIDKVKIIDDNLEKICLLCINDKNRDLYKRTDLFSELSIDSQKKLIDYIYNNIDKFEGRNKVNFFEKDIFNFLDKEVIIDRTKELKEIINSCVDANSFSYIFNREDKSVKDLLEQIDLHNDIDGTYASISNMDINDYIFGLYNKKKCMLLEYGLQKDEYALTNDDFIAAIYQVKNSGILFEEINDMFNELQSKAIKPDMSKYQEEVDNLTEMDETKFEYFIEDLKKLKNCVGILPEEYCDYLIKQKMDSNSCLNKNLEKYYTIFKRAFEDKTNNILYNNDIKNNIIQVSSELDENVLGSTGIQYIRYNETQIKELSEKNMDAINTMFHEIRHVLQKRHIDDMRCNRYLFLIDEDYAEKMEINPNEYKMLKEKIINKYDRDYYERNYIFMYNEIDARIHGAKGAYAYLKKLGLDNKKILNIQGKDFFECYEENLKLERKIYNIANLKKYKDDASIKEPEEERVKYTFRNILKENLNVLNEYPVLKLEYDEKGERKSGFEILRNYEEELKEYEENPEDAKINKLAILSSILKEEVSMYACTQLEDSRELLNFHTDNNVIKRHRDHIIENEFLHTIQLNEEGIWSIYLNETVEEKKEHFNELINNLYEFATQNPEETITKKILKEIEPYIQNKNEEKTSEEIEQLQKIDAEVSDAERNEAMSAIIEGSKPRDNDIDN